MATRKNYYAVLAAWNDFSHPRSSNKVVGIGSKSVTLSMLSDLKNKKILVLGFAKEGQDTYLALRKLFPKKNIGIADKTEKLMPGHQLSKLIKKDKYLKIYFGKNYLKLIKNYNLIIKSPGIPIRAIRPFLKKGTKVTSQTEIFMENCPGTIIGVTGTKGKGTTVTLIYQILKNAGFKARLVGNIGNPVFQLLLKADRNDIFVYELSSHQLRGIKKSPQVAVFLNLYPAHLDYFKNYKQYIKAKTNICRWQKKNDILIYEAGDKLIKHIIVSCKAKKIAIPKNYNIIRGIKIPLIGEFNLRNIMAAVMAAKTLGVKEKEIIKTIKNFKPLPHRLEFIGKYKGIEFYNDSLATVPQAVEEALRAFKGKVKTLIIGGSKSGKIDFSSLAKEILKSKVKNLILLSPGTGEDIWKKITSIQKNGLPKKFTAFSMLKAVKLAYKNTNKKEICLMSPASPSFNIFRNYKERGALFKKYVKAYAEQKKNSY